MPSKKQFTFFKKAKKLAKQRKIKVKSNILTENISVLLEYKSIEGSLIPKKDILWYKNLD